MAGLEERKRLILLSRAPKHLRRTLRRCRVTDPFGPVPRVGFNRTERFDLHSLAAGTFGLKVLQSRAQLRSGQHVSEPHPDRSVRTALHQRVLAQRRNVRAALKINAPPQPLEKRQLQFVGAVVGIWWV